jgi:hypothetical protein
MNIRIADFFQLTQSFKILIVIDRFFCVCQAQCVSGVTIAWRILELRTEQTASKYGR